MVRQLTVVSAAITRAFATKRWLHWVFVYGVLMVFFLVAKLFALPYILNVNAASNERKSRIKAAGIFLGFLEDLILVTLLVIALILLDVVIAVLARFVRIANPRVKKAVHVAGQILFFVIVFALVALTLAPFAADMLLMRSREMRFTTDLIVTWAREKDQAASLEIDPREVRLAKETIIGTVLLALFYSCVYVWWIDITYWLIKSKKIKQEAGSDADDFVQLTPTQGFAPLGTSADLEAGAKSKVGQSSTAATTSPQFDTEEDVTVLAPESEGSDDAKPTKTARAAIAKFFRHRATIVVVALAAYVVFIVITVAISKATTPLIAAIALNATVNELFRNLLHVTFNRGSGSSEIGKAEFYLEAATENFKLFKDDVLYRRTNGFKGKLAFDVEVDQENLPNVLVIGVESNRWLDSLYLSNTTARAKNMKKSGLTLTPQFDRWAKKGIAFNNMWSSWQTSRSLEAVLFGQIAYDSVTDTGTTTGRVDVELSGMPQFFKQRGYSTAFTCGSNVNYDQWTKFLPAHGFDSLLHEPDFKEIAERDYNIKKDDWDSKRRDFQWGVHDDLTFSILGDMILDDIKQQKERVDKKEAKKPFFRAHYTISSHVPFESTPTWFADEKLPDFSPMCLDQDESKCDFIKKYAKLRYFADMELGKFLDRMDKEGALKDTIVIITGDHGISPEGDASKMYDRQTDCQRVSAALIAQGRLGEYVGTMYTDAAMQYDWLNTIMDIIGLPSDGFMQTSVGRSLKRSVEWGTRLVWAFNPMKKLSVIRGHQRYVFDKETNDVGLFDTVEDPLEETSLLPSLNDEDAKFWDSLRSAGRTLNRYFKHRWDNKCLTDLEC